MKGNTTFVHQLNVDDNTSFAECSVPSISFTIGTNRDGRRQNGSFLVSIHLSKGMRHMYKRMAGVLVFMFLCLVAGLAASTNQLTEEIGRSGIVFVQIPSGSFIMGQSELAEPLHRVEISQFHLAKYEITYQQWSEVYDWAVTHGYDFTNPGEAGYNPQGNRDLNPVADINWYDAVKWCNALSEKEGRTPCYYLDAKHQHPYRKGRFALKNEWVKWKTNGYRLPTEAEYEYAERAGSTTRYHWGEKYDEGAKYSCLVRSHPVGSRLPNNWGLYDMQGNVYEWCWDRYGDYSAEPQIDPVGPRDGDRRVVRGGTCCQYNLLESARRLNSVPVLKLKYYGLRIACSVR